MTNWISVKDRLPEHADIVLALHKNNHKHVLQFTENKKVKELLELNGIPYRGDHPLPNDGYTFSSIEVPGMCLDNITHWVPLPESLEG